MSILGPILVTQPPGSLNADFILNADPHLYESYTISAPFSCNGGVIGFGSKGSQMHGNRDFGVYFDYTAKTISFRYLNSPVASRPYNLVPGRNYVVKYRKTRRYCSVAVYDLSSNDMTTLAYHFDYRVMGGPAIGRFALLIPTGQGNTANVGSVSVSVEDIIGAEMLYGGDSITEGAKLMPQDKSYPMMVMELSGVFNTLIHGSGSSNQQDMLNILPSILTLAPKRMCLLSGDNDNPNDTSYQPIRQEFVSRVRAAGITLYQLAMTPETIDGSYRLMHDYIMATDPNAIETFIPLLKSGSTTLGDPSKYIDYVHLNNDGISILANTVYNAIR